MELVALLGVVSAAPALLVRTDCGGALGALSRFSPGKRYNHPLGWLLSSIRDKGSERQTVVARFTDEQRAIYAADLLAGGDTTAFAEYTGLQLHLIQDISDTTITNILLNLKCFNSLMQGTREGEETE